MQEQLSQLSVHDRVPSRPVHYLILNPYCISDRMVPLFLCLVLASSVLPLKAARAPFLVGDAANAATRLHEPTKRSLQEGALSDPTAEEISTDPTQFAALLTATEVRQGPGASGPHFRTAKLAWTWLL